MEKASFNIVEREDEEGEPRIYITACIDKFSHTVSIPTANIGVSGCGIERMKSWAESLLRDKIKMSKRNMFCGECRNFLYEDTSGYGICSRDGDRHSCSEKCIY